MSAFPATPQMRQAPVGEFFRKLEETSGDRLPTWNGGCTWSCTAAPIRRKAATSGLTARANSAA